MISETNKTAISNLTQLAQGKGAEFESHEESILEAGALVSRPVSPVVVADQTALEAFMVNTAEGNEDHEQVVNDYAQVLGDGIAAQAALVKESVIPFITLVTDKTVAQVSAAKIPAYVVNQIYLAEIHDTQSIYEILSQYQHLTKADVMMPRGLPLIEEVDLVNNIMTGSSVLDKSLIKMLAEHDDGWAIDVYTRHFCSNVDSTGSFDHDISMMDEYLVVYQICENLLAGDLDLKEIFPGLLLETVLTDYRNQAALAMVAAHKNWDGLKATGLLVLDYPSASYIPEGPESPVINVIGSNYEAFLTAGGSPELVIGSCIGERQYETVALMNSAEHHQLRYNSYLTDCETELQKRAGQIIRDASVAAVKEAINSQQLSGQQEGLTDPVALEQAFYEVMCRFQDRELKADVYGCIRLAVCQAFYNDTSALEILTRMDAYLTTYKDMEPRAASYYVVLDMVVNHLTQQVVPA